MTRIVALDYGSKRTGIAVTDEMQLIATPLTTIATKELMVFLKDYISKELVSCIVVGDPKTMANLPSQISNAVNQFVKLLIQNFPNIQIDRYDERFTSSMALQSMIDNGIPKMKRRIKSDVDKVSATLILQSYLENKKFKSGN